MKSFKFAGMVAALAVVAALVMNYADVKRYIKIERM